MGKPILFNTKAIRAILEERKTATRKVIGLDLGLADMDKNDSSYLKIPDKYGDFHDAKDFCPYRVGGTLYARETWLKADDGLFYYKASETEISMEELHGLKSTIQDKSDWFKSHVYILTYPENRLCDWDSYEAR